jgi:mannosyltransferase
MSEPVPTDTSRGWRSRDRLTWALVVLAGAIALVIALLIRLSARGPLWLDEAQSVAIARLPLGQLFEALRADGSPPLYYLVLHVWMMVWGESVVALRLLSVLANAGCLALVWLLVRRLGGAKSLAWTAVLLGASLPWMARFGSETRMYALVCLLVAALGVACLRVAQRPGWRPILWAGLAWAALLLTHYWALFVVAAALLVGLVAWGGWRAWRPMLRRQAVALLGAGVLFAPWVPSLLFQVRHTGAPWARDASFDQLAVLPQEWAGASPGSSLWVAIFVTILLGLGALGGYLAPTSTDRAWLAPPLARRWGVGLTLGLCLVVLIALLAAYATGSAAEPRYTAVVVPVVVVLMSLGVAALPARLRLPVVGVVVLMSLMASASLATKPRTQAGEIAAALDAYVQPGDVVMFCPDQLAPAVGRLLAPATREQARFVIVPGRPGSTAEQNSPAQPATTTDSVIDRVDWVDYSARLDGLSAQLVADHARQQAAGTASSVWLITAGVYGTHRQTCNGMRSSLLNAGWRPKNAVEAQSTVLEMAYLERWAPRAPWEMAHSQLDQIDAPVSTG